MDIASIRIGHANNSSSTHSILLNATAPENICCEEWRYGWEEFHLKSRNAKLKYLATQVYENLPRSLSERMRWAIVCELLQTNERPNMSDDDCLGAYVDHQSVLVLPRAFHSEHLDEQFIKELSAYMVDNPAVSIAGGNDNESERADFGGKEVLSALGRESKHNPTCRKDGDWWTLYNPGRGNRVSLSFAVNPPAYAPTRPLLVDVKITDYCPHQCKFCYQESTTKGSHASKSTIFDIAYALGNAKVFEVALGGGETTAHPEFAEILGYFVAYGITPNFTSFNMSWAANTEIRDAVKKHCGSFAVSDLSHATIDRLGKWNKDSHPSGTLNIPLGCYDRYKVEDAIRCCAFEHIPFTLLGFKRFGRGSGFSAHDYAWVMDVLKGERVYRFGADTLFVGQFKEELLSSGVSEKLMVGGEGESSCYIDAVGLRMGPSSYSDKMHMLDTKGEAMWEHFPYKQ